MSVTKVFIKEGNEADVNWLNNQLDMFRNNRQVYELINGRIYLINENKNGNM